ncbi:carbohydrate ABC transporter permease [Pseudactinotalea suaedae]|uniref:carbohydrate ABC transporter permease n=1 Tax=Pseudactinotalea suaedae TaxID=1524924 RepID=UPI0019D63B3D|nr:carbohydrate ABC transporter permease [Pseudactinotalea suaedae]
MRILTALVMAAACALVLVPFAGIISTSLAPSDQVTRSGGMVLIPESISLDAYRSVLSGGVVTRALLVSIGVTVVGTAVSLSVSALLAYATSRRHMVGRTAVVTLILLSLLFTPGMIPSYLAVKDFGLINSYAALVLPVALSAFNVIVMRAFFLGLPGEVTDAARIDGANEWQIFTRIALPLSRAMLAVVGLFYAVGYWNAFFTALLYLDDAARWPLQLVLRTYVVNENPLGAADLGIDRLPAQPSLQMAILVTSVVPILCIYPFLQRHFATGVLTGAVKG